MNSVVSRHIRLKTEMTDDHKQRGLWLNEGEKGNKYSGSLLCQCYRWHDVVTRWVNKLQYKKKVT